MTDLWFGLGAGIVCISIGMWLRPSRRRLSVALVIGVPVFAAMGALIFEFLSAAALAIAPRGDLTTPTLILRLGIYLGAIVGSWFAWEIATAGPTGRGPSARGPVGYALALAFLAAIAVFCWIGIPGYIDLSAHQPPAHITSGTPFPSGTSSAPPSMALWVAGIFASLVFVATFAVLSAILTMVWKIFGGRFSKPTPAA